MNDKIKILSDEIEILEGQLQEKAQLEIKHQDEMKILNLRIINTRGRLAMLKNLLGK